MNRCYETNGLVKSMFSLSYISLVCFFVMGHAKALQASCARGSSESHMALFSTSARGILKMFKRVSPPSFSSFSRSLMFILLFLLIFPGQSRAKTLYVTDSIKITCRTGPDISNRIVALLRSGDAVEVIESKGGWSKVSFVKRNGEKAEGWVMNRYLMEKKPCRDRLFMLSTENEALKKKVSSLKEEAESCSKDAVVLKQNLEKATRDLNELKKRYNELKEGASGYIELKKRFKETSAALETAQQKLDALTLEVNELRSSHGYKWFGLGALVLFAGIVIGLVFGRQKRSRRSIYY